MANQDEIIKILANKYNVPEEEIEKAVDSQFEFAKLSMEKKEMPQVRLPFFGVFKPNKRKLKKLKELNNDTNT